MPSTLLAPLTVRVRHRRQPEEQYLSLGNLDPGDLFLEFENLLQSLQGEPARDESGETLLGVSRLDSYPRARRLEGQFETGHYGYSSRLVHYKTLDAVYDRRVEDAELLPFFFLLHLPKKPNQGILILQRTRGWGVKSVFENQVVRNFRPTPHLVEFHPLVPEQLVEDLRKASRAKRIRLTSFQVPQDIADAFAKGDRKELRADLVIRARGRKDFKLPSSLNALVRGRTKVGGFVEAQGEFPHSRVQVEVSVDGKSQKVSFDQRGRDMTGYHDVSDKVNIQAGHPTFASIRREARALLRVLKDEIQVVAPRVSPPPCSSAELPACASGATADTTGYRRTG